MRFPLGDMTKAETRELARRFGLSVADKHDSQDICFVPTGRYTDVIERLKPHAVEPGEIVDLDGRVLGRHDGIVHFTVGQRRGLGIAAAEPLYVVRLDAATRRVVVGPREALRTRSITLREVNWIGDGALPRGGDRREVFVKVRSTRPAQPAWLRTVDGVCEVELIDGEEGVSPGQACVFYDAPAGQARVLGGGFIARTLPMVDATTRSTRGRSRCRAPDKDVRGRGWATISTATASRRLTRAGRRSTIWCSARCSRRGGARRSRRPTGSAGACSMSASAPGCRSPTMRRRRGCAASTCPSRCCARRRSA